MKKKKETQEPIIEQILDGLFDHLHTHDEFDEETISNLRELANKGDLQKHQQVVKTIKVLPAHQE